MSFIAGIYDIRFVVDFALIKSILFDLIFVKGELPKMRPPETLKCSQSEKCRPKKVNLTVNLIYNFSF